MKYPLENEMGTLGKRGVIIVDASVLFTEAFDGSDKKNLVLDKKNEPVFAALTLLAQNGYEIIIPEMVAYECGGFMRDGHSTDVYFSKSSSASISVPTREFLSNAPKANAPLYIAPAHRQDTSAPARYMEDIFGIHTSPIRVAFKNIQIINVNKKTPNRNDFGDMAARQLAKKLIANKRESTPPSTAPVFYFAKDGEARTLMEAECPQVTSANREVFYKALVQQKLMHPSENLDVSIHDVSNTAFYKSLEGLAAEIEEKKKPPVTATEEPVGTTALTTTLTTAQRRFGKDWANLGRRPSNNGNGDKGRI